MRKPLSYFMYFKSHKKSSIAVVISIGLAIILIGAIQLYVTEMSEANARGDSNYENMTAVYKNNKPVPKEVLDKIKKDTSVDKVVKVVRFQYMIRSVFGTDSDFEGFYADGEDIKYIMDKLKVKFDKGSYVKNGDNKILINENAARFKKVSIGDFVGSDVRKDDYFPGKYKINDYINSLKNKQIDIQDYNSVNYEVEGFFPVFNMFAFIILAILIVVLTFTIGNMNYIHFFDRVGEFSILDALGYTKFDIFLKLAKEMCIVIVLGFGVGMILSFMGGNIFNGVYCIPKGVPVEIYNKWYVMLSAIVPIGSNKYLTITKLEEKAGKTYIYYKSDDFIDGFLPFFFKDDSENMYMRNMDENVIAPSGKDGFEVYDEPLLSKN